MGKYRIYGKNMGNIWDIYGDYADLLKTYMEKYGKYMVILQMGSLADM